MSYSIQDVQCNSGNVEVLLDALFNLVQYFVKVQDLIVSNERAVHILTIIVGLHRIYMLEFIIFFSGDLGGFLGLLLGGSAISVFEIVDLFLYNAVVKFTSRKVRPNPTTVKVQPVQDVDSQSVNAFSIRRAKFISILLRFSVA